MTEWKECVISDLGTVVGGATPSTKDPSNYEGGKIAWITPKDLSNYEERYIAHGERNITEKGLNSCSAQLMPKHSVLFTSRAPIGYIAIAENEICTNQGFKSIVPNKNTDYLFLYYLLKYNKSKIEGLGSGTTFKEVSGSTMKGVEVKVPTTLSAQKAIGSFLNTIDCKIEENRRINKNLAELLQTVYQERFGDVSAATEQGILADICSYSRDRVAVFELNASTYFSTENMLPGKAGATKAASLPTTPPLVIRVILWFPIFGLTLRRLFTVRIGVAAQQMFFVSHLFN